MLRDVKLDFPDNNIKFESDTKAPVDFSPPRQRLIVDGEFTGVSFSPELVEDFATSFNWFMLGRRRSVILQ